jgi:serine phosphatase RsbU (regulator of sigma subunit)
MVAANQRSVEKNIGNTTRNIRRGRGGRARLARELFNGRYQPGENLKLSRMAAEYGLETEALFRLFVEFQSIGMVTLSGNSSAIVRSPDPKEMYEAYEIRAALEEIGGRDAALHFQKNTEKLRAEIEAMRLAIQQRNLDAFSEHDVRFHRRILQGSQNELLLRVWDTLCFDLRLPAAIGKVRENLSEVVESHLPIVDALERGQGQEAGLLLRNHIETFLRHLKKADSDSGVYRAVVKDMENAKDVQKAFFPPKNVGVPGLSCQAFYRPAQGLGGDYYDFFPVREDRWGIAIGDVSGKGIGAALIMASLQASLRAQALHVHSDLGALMGDVDRLIYASSPVHFFASLFYAEFQPATRVLEYVNAGHNPPLVVRWRDGSSKVFELKAGGTPIGLLEESRFLPGRFRLETGDVLVAYTDGITESEDSGGDLWGQPRLENLLRGFENKTSEEIVQGILDERFAFADGQPQRDDMTLLVMRVVS